MIQIYFEAPHCDTHAIGSSEIDDCQKLVLAKLNPYSTKVQDENYAPRHQQHYHSNLSQPTPTSSGAFFRYPPHNSGAQIPGRPASHAHGVTSFAETSRYPQSSSSDCSAVHNVSRQIHSRPIDRVSASAGHRIFPEPRRPDTVIHIYNNPPAPAPSNSALERALQYRDHR